MIWGFIKLCVFTFIAVVTGVLCATVPIGGKTIAARAQELWAQPQVKAEVANVETRVKRGVDAATRDEPGRGRTKAERAPTPGEPPEPKATQVDPHAVAKVLADSPPADDFRPSERQAVQKLIQQRARKPSAHAQH